MHHSFALVSFLVPAALAFSHLARDDGRLPVHQALPIRHRDGGLKPKHLTWSAPGEGDVRAPCPALNTLANHGFLPHDGRNITLDKVTSAFGDGLNIDATLAATLFAAAPATNPLPNATWFDLDMLQPHDVIEHDASMSRADVYFNPSNLFDADTFDSFLSFFGANATFLSVNATAAARTRHAYAMSQINPEFNVTETNLPIMMGETALSILMWDDTPGAERDLFEYFFRNERFPTELGWTPRSTPMTLAQLVAVRTQLTEASPADVPMTFE